MTRAPPLTPAEAEADARLARVNEVLTPVERTLMEGVCGRGEMIEAVPARLFISADDELEILRAALDKSHVVFAVDDARGSIQ